MILEEFDEINISVFNPSDVQDVITDFPKIGVTCFSKKLIDRFVEIFNLEQISEIRSANGKIPIYKINYNGEDIALFMSRVGASACAIAYEEVIAMGLEKLVMFGTCGVLDKNIEDLAIIIPNSAIRDEGTSYHYLKASDEIIVNEKYKYEFKNILENYNYSYIEGKTWTIDAPYRETRSKVINRKKQNCICVEMECAAMSAVSKFRNKEFFQFFYAGDNLDNVIWEQRSICNEDKLSNKEKIIFLALELALKMK